MGSITVVNLTDGPIQSAIANAGNIHSGINGVLDHAYYHHNALSGTGYDVWEKWYVRGITEDFPHSDLSKIGWYTAAAVITLFGIAATVLSAGALAPVLLAYETAAGLAYAAGSTAAAIAAADTAFIAVVGVGAGLSLGVIVALGGVGITIGSPIYDYVVALKKCTVGPVGGQENRILSFTGTIPLNASQRKDAKGKPAIAATIPAGMTAETAPPPTFAGDLT